MDESSKLIQSSGGVFEVERNGVLLFSKKKLGRFPEDGEILSIIKAIDQGVPLDTAQQEAAKHAPSLPSFEQWLRSFFQRK